MQYFVTFEECGGGKTTRSFCLNNSKYFLVLFTHKITMNYDESFNI